MSHKRKGILLLTAFWDGGFHWQFQHQFSVAKHRSIQVLLSVIRTCLSCCRFVLAVLNNLKHLFIFNPTPEEPINGTEEPVTVTEEPVTVTEEPVTVTEEISDPDPSLLQKIWMDLDDFAECFQWETHTQTHICTYTLKTCCVNR